ncbi:MAG: hypothetical protein GY769_11355 [bacterium]|nr:hypothetical protein [bacterium]
MKNVNRILIAVALLAALSAPLAAYTVILKDGSQLIAQQAPTFEGDQAIIVLQSGTRTSIAANEIDLERTRNANVQELGSAMVLEDGQFTAKAVEPEPPQEERLSDLIARRRRETGPSDRPPASRDTTERNRTSAQSDLSTQQRTPYRDLAVLEAIQGAFKSQGVDGAKVYQGTTSDRLLIEVETNSEAAVFRSIKVAAGALSHVRANISSTIEAFELVLATSNRSRAGQFLMTTEDAIAIVDGEIEISSYFVDQVRF